RVLVASEGVEGDALVVPHDVVREAELDRAVVVAEGVREVLRVAQLVPLQELLLRAGEGDGPLPRYRDAEDREERESGHDAFPAGVRDIKVVQCIRVARRANAAVGSDGSRGGRRRRHGRSGLWLPLRMGKS